MKEYRLTDWLPTTKKEIELRGWNELDIILFSADAYVDHPSFGAAVIGRILEAEGLKIAIVPQPNWRDDLRDFKKLGRPRLFFGISGGCMDSMVNKYTANKRLRSKMRIHRTGVRICGRTILLLFTVRFSRDFIRMFLSSWEELRPA